MWSVTERRCLLMLHFIPVIYWHLLPARYQSVHSMWMSNAKLNDEMSLVRRRYTSCSCPLLPIHYSASSSSNYISRFLPAVQFDARCGPSPRCGREDPPGCLFRGRGRAALRRLWADWAWNDGAAGRHCVACRRRLYNASSIDLWARYTLPANTRPHVRHKHYTGLLRLLRDQRQLYISLLSDGAYFTNAESQKARNSKIPKIKIQKGLTF